MKKIILLFAISTLLISCEIFSTREAEFPNSNRDDFLPATTPTILFENLKNSFKNKIAENYISCFVDASFTNYQFTFIPTGNANAVYTAFNDWDLLSERSYFTNLSAIIDENKPIILSLSELGYNQYADSAVYNFSYILNVNSNDESITNTYEGNLKFTLVLDSRQQWAIKTWTDFEGSSQNTWSELKGRIY